MKKIGSVAEFGDERNRELVAAFRAAMRTSGNDTLMELFARAAATPTSRFWVSETRATEVIAKMLRGESIGWMSAKRREMFSEIYRRVVDYRAEHPGSSVYEACIEAVNSPAPEFYLTPGSARVIIYSARRG